jgi:hypothetical protein
VAESAYQNRSTGTEKDRLRQLLSGWACGIHDEERRIMLA